MNNHVAMWTTNDPLLLSGFEKQHSRPVNQLILSTNKIHVTNPSRWFPKGMSLPTWSLWSFKSIIKHSFSRLCQWLCLELSCVQYLCWMSLRGMKTRWFSQCLFTDCHLVLPKIMSSFQSVTFQDLWPKRRNPFVGPNHVPQEPKDALHYNAALNCSLNWSHA